MIKIVVEMRNQNMHFSHKHNELQIDRKDYRFVTLMFLVEFLPGSLPNSLA